MARNRLLLIVAACLALLATAAITGFAVGRVTGNGTSSFAGTITLSNWDKSQGCVKLSDGKEECGAFVSEGGGSNDRFVLGAKVEVEIGDLKVDGNKRRIILLRVS
ncbi:hypothetical protein [Micromonospora sp. 067-2]|uniref:hypothetical protein n=1 Tax=Micromonospora sp. 067-2 TaxID=2789270 RepID=UPI00397A9AE9